jgi:hypothetical protein
MYFPRDIAKDLVLSVHVRNNTIVIEHNYALTPVRQEILQTKLDYLLMPLFDLLRSRDALPSDWQEIIQSALMCCPLLTINLIDPERMPPTISWLGLMLAVLMGNNGVHSLRKGIDQ